MEMTSNYCIVQPRNILMAMIEVGFTEQSTTEGGLGIIIHHITYIRRQEQHHNVTNGNGGCALPFLEKVN